MKKGGFVEVSRLIGRIQKRGGSVLKYSSLGLPRGESAVQYRYSGNGCIYCDL